MQTSNAESRLIRSLGLLPIRHGAELNLGGSRRTKLRLLKVPGEATTVTAVLQAKSKMGKLLLEGLNLLLLGA